MMQQNGIYHKGIEAIAYGLSANPNLRILNLNDNTIGLKGARALAKVLPTFQNLEELNLGDCLLKTKGAWVLAEALAIIGNHTSLKNLDLSHNEIRIDGGKAIAQAMIDKVLLSNLQLDGNMFGTKGRDVLEQILTNFGKANALNSFDEDEDDDNEDGDDTNSDEDEDDEESEKCESDNEDTENDKDNIRRDDVAHGIVTVAEFLKSPIGEKLLLLQGDNAQAFIDHAEVCIDMCYQYRLLQTCRLLNTYIALFLMKI